MKSSLAAITLLLIFSVDIRAQVFKQADSDTTDSFLSRKLPGSTPNPTSSKKPVSERLLQAITPSPTSKKKPVSGMFLRASARLSSSSDTSPSSTSESVSERLLQAVTPSPTSTKKPGSVRLLQAITPSPTSTKKPVSGTVSERLLRTPESFDCGINCGTRFKNSLEMNTRDISPINVPTLLDDPSASSNPLIQSPLECTDKLGTFQVISEEYTSAYTTCKNIAFMRIKNKICERNLVSGGSVTGRCPVACTNSSCYSPAGARQDSDEEFMSLNFNRTCDTVKVLMPMLKRRVCASNALPDKIPVQEKCPISCSNTKYTCADKEFPFVISEGVSKTAVERTCNSLKKYGKYRNKLCEAKIFASTEEKEYYVKNICPATCGIQTECFCKDTKEPISIPQIVDKDIFCHEVARYNSDEKSYWCDPKRKPFVNLLCPITCGNSRCDSRDTTDTISLLGGKWKTTCSQINNFKTEEKRFACGVTGAIIGDIKMKASQVCKIACAEIE